MMLRDLTCDEVRRLLNYDPATGVFTWKVRPCYSMRAGDVAGSPDPKCRYIRIKINERLYLAHRLAWLYAYGVWPENEIDHIDMDRTNNRLSNLREATRSQNQRNKKRYANSKTGVRGVYWHLQHRKYAAVVCLSGKRKHIGLFRLMADAERAVIAAENGLGLNLFRANTNQS